MPPATRHPMCPKCGADMRATFTDHPGDTSPVWRCIRCGAETPRAADAPSGTDEPDQPVT